MIDAHKIRRHTAYRRAVVTGTFHAPATPLAGDWAAWMGLPNTALSGCVLRNVHRLGVSRAAHSASGLAALIPPLMSADASGHAHGQIAFAGLATDRAVG